MTRRPETTPPTCPNPQRRSSLALLSGLLLGTAACGGGGGGGEEDSTPTNRGGSGGRSPDAAPVSGSFGGGQGRILFVSGDKTFHELDLASRRVTKLADIGGRYSAEIEGGLTRANNGRIAVMVDTGELDLPVEIRIYSASGALEFTHPAYFWGIHSRDGAAISPDGQQVAVVGTAPLNDNWRVDNLIVVLVEVASGRMTLVVAESASELNLTPTLCWSPDNTLYLLTEKALYRIDRQNGTATKVHAMDLAPPYAAMVTANNREIWFHQGRGNQYGGTIWSLDIASGQTRRRSLRSAGWGQHSPVLSPDGQWLLAQEGVSGSDYVSVYWIDYYITAIRLTDPPIDVHRFADEVLDAAGKKLGSKSRMVWY